MMPGHINLNITNEGGTFYLSRTKEIKCSKIQDANHQVLNIVYVTRPNFATESAIDERNYKRSWFPELPAFSMKQCGLISWREHQKDNVDVAQYG